MVTLSDIVSLFTNNIINKNETVMLHSFILHCMFAYNGTFSHLHIYSSLEKSELRAKIKESSNHEFPRQIVAEKFFH